MTNYNERLDEILDSVWNEACNMMEDGGTADVSRTEAKQAIKQLVADEMMKLLDDEPLMDVEILHTTGYTDDVGELRICRCGADYSDSERKVQHNACRANLRSKLAEWLGEEK